MDDVCSLSLKVAVKLLQAAVRDSQGSKRASYAVKDRPEWWKENHRVKLPDGTNAVTGKFISHSKSAWTLDQAQATLVLYYYFLNGDEEPTADTPQQSRDESASHLARATKTEESVSSNPSCVTRSQKKEEGLVDDSLRETPGTHVIDTENASYRTTRARLKQPVSRAHPTPLPRLGKSKARRIVISESEGESSPSASPAKRQPPPNHTQRSVRIPETQTPNKATDARRTTRRPRAKGENEELQTRSELSSPPVFRAPPGKTTSPKKRDHIRNLPKTIKRSVRVRPAGTSRTVPLPQASEAIKSEMLEGRNREASPRLSNREHRRYDTFPKAVEQTPPAKSLRLKRSVTRRHSQGRTPLAPLQDDGDEHANRALKRRKLDGADSFDKSKHKRSKSARVSHDEVEEVDVTVDKENERPLGDDSGGDVFAVETRLKKRKQGDGTITQAGAEDGFGVATSTERVTEAQPQSSIDADKELYNESGEEEDEAAIAAAQEKRNEQIMAQIRELDRARDEDLQNIEDKCKSHLDNLQQQLKTLQSKQRHMAKVQRMHMRKEDLSTLVRDMVYKYNGDADQILVKEFESVAQGIVQRFTGAGHSGAVGGNGGGASVGVRLMEGAKTPRNRSVRNAVAIATAQQKRLVYERDEANRVVSTVRRSKRNASRVATAKTKRILNRMNIGRSEEGALAQGQDKKDGISDEAFTSIHAQMRRVGALPNGREALAALKARIDQAFSTMM